MSERPNFAPSRDAILADYAELLSYGLADVDAARRLDVGMGEITRWLKAKETVSRRRNKRVGIVADCDRIRTENGPTENVLALSTGPNPLTEEAESRMR